MHLPKPLHALFYTDHTATPSALPVMCCAVLCCAVLSWPVLCCAVLCCAVLCCAVLCCTLHCFLPLHAVLHCTALHCLPVLCCTLHFLHLCTALSRPALYCTASSTAALHRVVCDVVENCFVEPFLHLLYGSI